MAHLRTPPRHSPSSAGPVIGLITPSTPHNLRYTSQPQQCPDAPFLPSNLFVLPSSTSTTLRTSPRTRKGDPTKPSHLRKRTSTGDRGTLIQEGIPPTPEETPVQKRRRETEMKRRLEETDMGKTSRRLFPVKPVITEDQKPFEIYTDTQHREPLNSPNNPFKFEVPSSETVGTSVSPRKRKLRSDTTNKGTGTELADDEIYYTFRGRKIVRKIPRGPNGEGWRETVKPVRLFQKEIEEQDRRRKRRRMIMEDVEEVDTEEDHSAEEMDADEQGMTSN